MTRREWLWVALAVVFATVNLLGVWYAVVRGEMVHCLIHVGLLLATPVVTWRMIARRPVGY
ncbi:hypothetical protein [Roseisolibacter agri]|uniref:Uncharacterized protein n=1 Tax=Roseisolibacter agri TaxID=2014610 RepID=A0AA37Q9V6_9BACT|nr:hypothetical protein [Roseisolibacter agri]GLC25756.1 hypothetical protein rosag_22690 [Roseisolibacter agri]